MTRITRRKLMPAAVRGVTGAMAAPPSLHQP